MKTTLLSLLILIGIQGFAQTFKITKVETNKDYRYQEMNKRMLNKSVKATFNDNTVTITPTDESDPITLKKTSDYVYSFSTIRGAIQEYFTATFYRTFGVISSLEFTYSRKSGDEVEKTVFIAKRF